MNGSSTPMARLRWKTAIGSLLTMALLGAACTSRSSTSASSGQSSAEPSSNSLSDVAVELDGCMPACKDGNSIVPGELPEGEYDTVWFFGGQMRLTFHAGWTSREDSTGEFVASPLYAPDQNDVLFWEDVYPIEPKDVYWDFPVKPNEMKPIKGVSRTAAGLLDWMRSSAQLQVSAPSSGTIGVLPATVVDVRVADDAVNDDPDCPVHACVNFLGFPQWDGPWGIAGGPVRFYLSDVTYGGRDHLFVAAIYPEDPADMKALGRAGERLIETVRVPASPA